MIGLDILTDASWIKAQWHECEAELVRVKAERDRYKQALLEIAEIAALMPVETEHRIAARALEGVVPPVS